MKTNQLQKNILNEWTSTTIDDVCHVLKGKGLSKGVIYSNGKNKCILYGQLFTTYNEVINDVKSKTDSDDGVLSEIGDILIPGSTTTKAEDLAIASALLEKGVLLGGDINILRKKDDFYDPVFFAYYLTHFKNKEIGKLGQGTTIIHLYGKNLKNVKLLLPTIKEQKKIAEILSKVDEEINKTDELILKTEKLKNGLMNNLFTKGIGHKKFKNTKLGEIPEDWEIKKLGEVAFITRGGSPRPIESYITEDKDGLNWLKIGDIETGAKYIYKTTQKIKKSGLSKTTMVKIDDFILSNSMSFGRPYIMKIDACIHDGWLAFKDINTSLIIKDYLYYLLSSKNMQDIFRSISAGSGVKNLKRESVSNLFINLPKINEQQKISEILSSIDKKLEKQKKLREKLTQLKKGLMSDLLSGKVRVINK